MAITTEETALTTRTEQTGELAPTAGAAEKQFEIQSAIIIAKRFPRNEDAAFEKLMKAASRSSFAEEAFYRFPRGWVKDEDTGKWVRNFVEGPSVNLAREAARVWQNIRYGLEIASDGDESRQIRGWAWDVETNTKVSAEDQFKKLIQRKNREGDGTSWVVPDERDLRELTNRRGAICVRNSLLQVLPKDLIEDALKRCHETLEKEAAQDPDGARKKLILAFSELNVTPEMLEESLGHPLSECSPAEITKLRGVYKSIADGNSTWAEYTQKKKEGDDKKGGLGLGDLSKPKGDGAGKQGKQEKRGGENGESSGTAKTDSPAPKRPAEPAGNPNYGTEDFGDNLFN